ncbi:MAG: hypothetical protein M5U16_11025 [Hyphomicrobium sp.]|nr:hypothetical protein [Hyphomicrobium sp.]
MRLAGENVGEALRGGARQILGPLAQCWRIMRRLIVGRDGALRAEHRQHEEGTHTRHQRFPLPLILTGIRRDIRCLWRFSETAACYGTPLSTTPAARQTDIKNRITERP